MTLGLEWILGLFANLNGSRADRFFDLEWVSDLGLVVGSEREIGVVMMVVGSEREIGVEMMMVVGLGLRERLG